jgi:predicted nucleic acid-binding protein
MRTLGIGGDGGLYRHLGFFGGTGQGGSLPLRFPEEMDTSGKNRAEVLTTDYVRLESWSLIQRRLGPQAVMAFQDDWLPLCKIHVVGSDGFERAAAQWRIAQRRNLSLVDLTSFDAMRQLAIRTALAFDGHFQEMGYLEVEA